MTAPSNENGSQHVVHARDEKRPFTRQCRCADRLPSQYIHATAQKSAGAARLGNGGSEHHGREQARERDADARPAPPTHFERAPYHDAECDAAYRLSEEVRPTSSPRAPARRQKNRRTPAAALSPAACHNGYQDNARMNCSATIPNPPT